MSQSDYDPQTGEVYDPTHPNERIGRRDFATRFGDTAKLAAALAKAQGVIEDAVKDAQNPHFKSKFADLSSVRAAIRGPLSDNGIAYVQLVRSGGKAVEVETLLLHDSGQVIGDTLTIPLLQNTPQAVGSAISYGRRYSLMSIVGLAADDDDAENAMNRKPNGSRMITDKTDAWEARKDDRFAPNGAARKSSAAAKRDGDWATMEHDMADAKSAVSMQRLWDDYRQTKYPVWNKDWQREADELFAHRLAQFSKGDDLRETLEDSAAEVAAPTDVQIDAYRERAAWLSAAKTPDDLNKRAKNPEHAIEVNKLTEGQKRNLRELYQDVKARLQAELMAAL
jgi:hypothetical protein